MTTHLRGVFLLAIVSACFLTLAFTAKAQSTNLISNGSLEISSGSSPSGWTNSYWGSPIPTFTYPVAGHNGSKAASVALSTNSTGDANWQPSSPVTVTPGMTYTYSTWYNSNVATEIDAEYTNTNGQLSYVWIADVPSSNGVWQQLSVNFTIPAGIAKATVYQLVFNKGTLAIDDVSLAPFGSTTPPPSPSPSPSPPPPSPSPTPPPPALTFAASPTSIKSGQSSTLTWSSANATSCNASGGWTGTKALSGSQIVTPTATTTYALACVGNGGSSTMAATVNVSPATVTPPPPPPPPAPSPTPTPPPSATQFSQGMVTLSFDDAWASQYTNALPILQASGVPATFYLISEVIQGSWQDYMTPPMAVAIANAGHEIADHTITHTDLATLSQSGINTEITASRTYLQNLTGKAITSIAYPYGSVNATVKSLVKQAGYTSGRGVDDSRLNTPSSDKYNLFSQCILKSDSLASIKAQIDKAKTNRQWYILCLHEIRTINDEYSIPASELQQIIDYIKQSGVKIVTVSQGRALMAN